MDLNSFNATIKPFLRKINFGTLCAALILFFLPWTRVQCSGQDVATQSGFQTIYGGASLADEFDEMRDGDAGGDDDADIGIGLIAFLSFMLVLAATLVAGLALFKQIELPINPGVLAAAALMLLLFQAMIGFPIDRSVSDARKQSRSDEDSMTRAMGAAVPIRTERLAWFYIELLMLAVPAALYVLPRIPAGSAKASGTGSTAEMEASTASPPTAAPAFPPAMPPSAPETGAATISAPPPPPR